MRVENEIGELGDAAGPRMADAGWGSEAVWRDFVAASTTLGPTPGERERWHRGRGRYAVWVLRMDAAAVVERALEAGRRVDAWVRRVAAADLHVTVHVAGFPAARPRFDDDVSEAALSAQAEALRGCLERPPRLLVGGANAFRSAAILDVSDPWGDLASLKRRLAAVAPELRFGPYHPHVTVGCFTAAAPTAEVARGLADLRALEPIAVGPERIELVELDAAVEGAGLETRRRIPLTGRAPS